MANDFSSQPIILDSIMATGYENVPSVNTLDLYPRVIHWDNPTSAGDVFEIDDKDSNILFRATCRANGQGEYYDIAEGVRWQGLWKLITLDSGILYIYYET